MVSKLVVYILTPRDECFWSKHCSLHNIFAPNGLTQLKIGNSFLLHIMTFKQISQAPIFAQEKVNDIEAFLSLYFIGYEVTNCQ